MGAMAFHQRVIERDRFQTGLLAEREALPRADADIVARRDGISLRQPGVGESVIGIRSNRLLEQVDAFLNTLGFPAIPKLASLEIQTVRFGVACACAAETVLCGACQPKPQAV